MDQVLNRIGRPRRPASNEPSRRDSPQEEEGRARSNRDASDELESFFSFTPIFRENGVFDQATLARAANTSGLLRQPPGDYNPHPGLSHSPSPEIESFA